jgi:hypothetical protein
VAAVTGLGKYLKEKNPNSKVQMVDEIESLHYSSPLDVSEICITFIYVCSSPLDVVSWRIRLCMQIYGVEPAEANVLNGGKAGKNDIQLNMCFFIVLV